MISLRAGTMQQLFHRTLLRFFVASIHVCTVREKKKIIRIVKNTQKRAFENAKMERQIVLLKERKEN